MTNDEYRALVEAGPALVMVAKDDMLKLLDRLEKAEKMVAYLQATAGATPRRDADGDLFDPEARDLSACEGLTMTRAAPDRQPRQRAPRHPRPETLLRVAAMERLLEQGYTVADAGRELGLSRHLTQDTARRFSLRAFHGAIAEAKSDAGVKGNAARWGA